MKKGLMKRLACIGLCVTMVMGACACGSDSESGGKKPGKKNANSQLAKENVYRQQEIEGFPDFLNGENGYVNLNSFNYNDDKVYLLYGVQIDASDEENDFRLVSLNRDGSGLDVVKLQMPVEEEQNQDNAGNNTSDAETDDSEDDTVTDDTIADGESGIELYDEGVDDDMAVDPDDGEEDDYGNGDYSYSYFGNFLIAKDMTVYGVKTAYSESYEGDNYSSTQTNYICAWNIDGSLKYMTVADQLASGDDEWKYVNRLMVSKSGAIYAMIGGNTYYRAKVEENGNLGQLTPLKDEVVSAWNNLNGTVDNPDGTLSLIYSDENDYSKRSIAVYDVDTDTMQPGSPVPSNWNGYDGSGLERGADGRIYFSDNSGVSTFKEGDTEVKLVMSYINSDVDIASFVVILPLAEDSFFGIYNLQDDYNVQKAGIFTHVAPEDIVDKEVLVLAGEYISVDMKKRVIEYNKSSETSRIVIKDYDSYNTYDDYDAGIKQLNNDIISGQMPDILCTYSLPVENYINKGLLADIGALIEKDEELSQKEFLQNVFRAYTVNGKLYSMVPSFSVATVIAKKSLVGDRTTWTMKDMQEVLAGMGPDASALGPVSREDFMDYVLQYCGNEYVDFASGECKFDSDSFISVMEYAKTLPETIDWDNIYQDDTYWDNYDSQYRENRTLCSQLYIGSFDNLSYTINGYFGEPVALIGFPNETGKGSYVSGNDTMAISSKSSNIEEAWKFLRYYLTDDYQKTLDYGLPVSKEAFLEKSKRATKKPSYTDYETGEEVEYDETININGEDIIVPPLSQEQADEIVNFVQTVDNGYYFNDQISAIITEEIGAFYSGQKTSKEVADIIQKRVQIFVDENR